MESMVAADRLIVTQVMSSPYDNSDMSMSGIYLFYFALENLVLLVFIGFVVFIELLSTINLKTA